MCNKRKAISPCEGAQVVESVPRAFSVGCPMEFRAQPVRVSCDHVFAVATVLRFSSQKVLGLLGGITKTQFNRPDPSRYERVTFCMHNELRYKQGTKESVKSTFILSKSKAFLRHGNAYNSVSFFSIISACARGYRDTM